MLEDHLRPKVALWLHIAVGVALGILAASFIIWRASILVVEIAAADVAATLKHSAQRARQVQTAEQEAAAEAGAVNRRLLADKQRAEEAARQQKLAANERRELAWTRFYRKPPACDEGKGGDWTVDCANDYIRARTRFAEMYDAGKL